MKLRAEHAVYRSGSNRSIMSSTHQFAKWQLISKNLSTVILQCWAGRAFAGSIFGVFITGEGENARHLQYNSS